jgi:hypothetical protein
MHGAFGATRGSVGLEPDVIEGVYVSVPFAVATDLTVKTAEPLDVVCGLEVNWVVEEVVDGGVGAPENETE